LKGLGCGQNERSFELNDVKIGPHKRGPAAVSLTEHIENAFRAISPSPTITVTITNLRITNLHFSLAHPGTFQLNSPLHRAELGRLNVPALKNLEVHKLQQEQLVS
jgi:hypothetical protein